MPKNLLIVESPAKAKTIEKYLGKDFTVKSSYGHIRDLEKSDDAIDIKNGFAPKYVVTPDKYKVVKELKDLVQKVDHVWLATDEDREGEAISWHLCQVLGLDEKPPNASFSARSPNLPFKKPSWRPVRWTSIWWMHNRPAVCSTGL